MYVATKKVNDSLRKKKTTKKNKKERDEKEPETPKSEPHSRVEYET